MRLLSIYLTRRKWQKVDSKFWITVNWATTVTNNKFLFLTGTFVKTNRNLMWLFLKLM